MLKIMDSILTRQLYNPRANLVLAGKYRAVLLMTLAVVLTAIGVRHVLNPCALVELAQANQLIKSGFYSGWQQGKLVVLMRHVERCDHSTNPCLAQSDGVTRKGQSVALAIGSSLRSMGVTDADIYNSPLRRTEQTASLVFNRTTPGQEWLANCRKSMLDDVVSHKRDQHNLILVTHSECISQVEESLNVPNAQTLDYGSSLILSVDPKDHTAQVVGQLDAQSWARVLANRP
jgi:phosphohistidine phosphatase SixA